MFVIWERLYAHPVFWHLVTLFASFEAETFRKRIRNATMWHFVYRHTKFWHFSLGRNAYYGTSFRRQM